MPRAARRELRPRPDRERELERNDDVLEPMDEEIVIAEEMTTPIRVNRESNVKPPYGDPCKSDMDRTMEEDSESDGGDYDGRDLRTMRRKRQRKNIKVETPPEVKHMKSLDEIVKKSAIPFKGFPTVPASYPTTLKTKSGSEIITDASIVIGDEEKLPKGGSDSSLDASRTSRGRGRGGRKRGRPRGSKSSTYNLRNGRRKPVLKPAFGPGAANASSTVTSASAQPSEGAIVGSEAEKDVEMKSASGDTTKKDENGESVTMVRPLFSRHYIVRRPFALPDEKPIEFVMHETYFSRMNPYSTKKAPGEQQITPCNDDLKFFQDAINNLIMNGMNPMDAVPGDHQNHDQVMEHHHTTISGSHSHVGQQLQSKAEPDLDDTLETKNSLENAEEESDERELEEKPKPAAPVADNFMTNILFMDAEDKSDEMNVDIQFNSEIEPSSQKRRSAVDVCQILESSG